MTYLETTFIVADDSPSIDAFGRWRISNPQTIFDSTQIFSTLPEIWEDSQTSGSGTGTSYDQNTASTTISVGAATAGTRVRQTYRSFHYQPGKSQLIFMTGVLGAGAAGITRRIGLFNANNGLFFELSGTTLNVVRRTYVTGSAVDNAVAQSSWNIDKLNGTGRSGINIDTSKTQIFVIDFEWLGVGRVRFGFVIDGVIYYCHQLLIANSLTEVYMSTPNLPLRYEISNSGAGGAASLKHICCTVISEGGQERNGIVLSHTNNVTTVACSSAGTAYALLGIRLKSGYIGCTIDPLTVTLMATSVNDSFRWELRLNPTVASTFTYSDLTNSAVQVATGVTANTVTGGTVLQAGYGKTETTPTITLANDLVLGASIAGVVDTLVLVVTPVATSTDMLGSLTWREYR